MTEKIPQVQKRDGRIVSFDRTKIAEAIFKAARSVGGQDRYLADDLSEAVTLYLEKEFGGRMPTVEQIQDIVEKVLIKTGHAKTAKAYILYRERRARIRRVRAGGRPESLAEEEGALKEIRELRDIRWSVRRSDDCVTEWDPARIVDALVRETGLARNIAEVILVEVEEQILASKIAHLTSALVRELVNAKLVEYGLEEARRKHARLGVPVYDVRSLLAGGDEPDDTTVRLGAHIKKEFALTEVFSPEVTDAHLRGDIHLHGLEAIDRLAEEAGRRILLKVSISLERFAPEEGVEPAVAEAQLDRVLQLAARAGREKRDFLRAGAGRRADEAAGAPCLIEVDPGGAGTDRWRDSAVRRLAEQASAAGPEIILAVAGPSA